MEEFVQQGSLFIYDASVLDDLLQIADKLGAKANLPRPKAIESVREDINNLAEIIHGIYGEFTQRTEFAETFTVFLIGDKKFIGCFVVEIDMGKKTINLYMEKAVAKDNKVNAKITNMVSIVEVIFGY